MVAVITELLRGLFTLLAGLLPTSPFADWARLAPQMQTGLAWLNWVVDFGGMVQILGTWVLMLVGITLAKVVIRKAILMATERRIAS